MKNFILLAAITCSIQVGSVSAQSTYSPISRIVRASRQAGRGESLLETGTPGGRSAYDAPCSGTTVEWTAKYPLRSPSSNNHASAIAVDSTGNSIVAGFITDEISVTKYDVAGQYVWSSHYHGPHDSIAYPVAIAADRRGNIYVTGYSVDISGGKDFLTLKYDSLGVARWIRRFNDSSNADDYASAITLGKDGSVYVAGSSTPGTAGTDFAVIKYDTLGAMRWVARYNGPAGGSDESTAIALDDSENVVVTGASVGTGGKDFATVKFDSSGTMLWAQRYDGPAQYDDVPAGVSIDGSGSIIVAGSSFGWGTDFDYCAIKYTRGGAQLWASRYNSGTIGTDYVTSLALDQSGNAYVGGLVYEFPPFTSYVVVKYDTAGTTRWVRQLSVPYYDAAYCLPPKLTVDGAANVYLTGSSYVSITDVDYLTVKYSTDGVLRWSKAYAGTGNGYDTSAAIAVAPSGNIVLTGTSRGFNALTDLATVCYDSLGNDLWTSLFYADGNSASWDAPNAMTLDRSGNIYIAASSQPTEWESGYLTLKWNPGGALQWAARYRGTGTGPSAIAVDSSGNVYVAGTTDTVGTKAALIIQYGASGGELRTIRDLGPDSVGQTVAALFMDPAGNFYVTGMGYTVAGTSDFSTMKYDAAGTLLWRATYDGPLHDADEPRGLVVDRDGNVYVTGRSKGLDGSYDYATVKYDAGGTEQWVARFAATTGYVDYPRAIALDSSGNVFVTGYGRVSGNNDFITIEYSSDGTQLWEASYNGPGNGTDQPVALSVDRRRNAIVTGFSKGAGGTYDYATVCYDSTGQQKWVARYDGAGAGSDAPLALTLDQSGNTYVTGRAEAADIFGDWATVKYDSNGTGLWVARYDGPAKGGDFASAISIDSSGRIVVAGAATDADGQKVTIVRYDETGGTPLPEGWNLVSLPRRATDRSRTTLFPASVSQLFSYEGSYVQRDSMEVGRGYWLRVPAGACSFIAGDLIVHDTVEVQAGWNLIGALGASIPVASVASDPPGIQTGSFFGYNGSYFVAASLDPGMGYWIRSTQAGKLILSAAFSETSNRIRIVDNGERPPAPPGGDVPADVSSIPAEYALHQNYPNPFNPTATIGYELPVDSRVRLTVYNILGQNVAELVDGIQSAGYRTANWNASGLPSGIYFCRIEATAVAEPMRSFVDVRKMALVK